MLKRVLVTLNIIALVVLAGLGLDAWIQVRARQVTIAIISPLVQQRPTPPTPVPVAPIPQPAPPVHGKGR